MTAKRTHYDDLIVGSGVAGGLVAERLTREGRHCVVLEAGRHFRTEDFPLPPLGQGRLFWRQGLDLTVDGGLFVLRGKCVGGSSVVNQALLDRFPEPVWERWRRKTGVPMLRADVMNARYDHLLGGGRFAHQVIPESRRNRNATLFADGLARRGWRVKGLHRAQADCGYDDGQNCMDCLAGCPRGSKQSSLVTTLARAMERGLEIESEVHVIRVRLDGSRIRVTARRNGRRLAYSADRLILAGGSLGTSELLLRSGFKRALPALGEGFHLHPQYYSWALFDDAVDAHTGAFQSVASETRDYDRFGYKFENVAMPPDAMSLLMPRSERTDPAIRDYRRWACAEVSIRDTEPGRLGISRLTGGIRIDKPLSPSDRAKRSEGEKVLADMYRDLGARRIVHGWLGLSVHPMGGCALGTDPRRSVVGPDFRLHGTDNVYVADSSLFPDAPGFNPSLTVMALADQAADAMIDAGRA